MTEFKVGDTVEHNGRRRGVLTYGPFQSVSFTSSEAFLLKEEGGAERVVRAGYLKALPTFAVGDKIQHRTFGAGEVAFGPFVHSNGPGHYLIVNEEGKHLLSDSEALAAVPTAGPIKVGNIVRVLKDNAEFADVKAGDTFTVAEMMSGGRIAVHAPLRVGGNFWYFEPESLEKVVDESAAFTYRGIAYEYGAAYRDREGDIFEFKAELSRPGTADRESDGTPLGRTRSDQEEATFGQWAWSLAEVVRNYGPLQKI